MSSDIDPQGQGTNELLSSLVYLADTLVSGFDVVDLADRLVQTCLQLPDVSAAGIMLDDQRGSLRVLASSSERTRLLELLELQNEQGPCLDAFTQRKTVMATELQTNTNWPMFTAAATAQGINATVALPMRLRERVVGVANLFSKTPTGMSAADLRIAQALTSMATIGILTHRTLRRQEVLAQQLQTALNSRIVIEQAKGVIAERAGVNMGVAFDLLRSAARASRRPLSEVAADVAQGNLNILGLPSARDELSDQP